MSDEQDPQDPRGPATWSDRRQLRTRATVEQAWSAWAEPEIIAQWFADRAHGEAVEGGTLTHVFETFGMEVEHRVVEVVPGERLVLEAVGPSGVPFRQQIHVRRDGGTTLVDLVHSGFGDDAPWGDEFEGIDSGWTMALAVLRHYLEHHYGRPRHQAFAMRPVSTGAPAPAPSDASAGAPSFDALFRSAEGLGRWLTRAGAVGEVGEAVALELREGGPLHGQVLAWTGREVALSWAEQEGTLELKSFPFGRMGLMIALRASSWSASPPDRAAMERWMQAALDRLAPALA